MCRAVVITGLPFAPSFDPKVKMKREFLDYNKTKQNMKSIEDGGFGAKTANLLSGHEWYTQQAHRAVNQAIGRVIRNRNDYGAVLLLDSRFGLPGNQQGLSMWVRPHILEDEGMGKTISSLVKFYKQAAISVEQRKLNVPLPRSEPNKVSVILKYEDEEMGDKEQVEDENRITKVAIIRKTDESAKSDSGNELYAGADTTFVPSTDIIARIDTKGAESRSLVKLARDEKPADSVDSKILDSRSKDLMAVQEAKSSSSASVKSPASEISPAKKFFLQLQTCMTKEEIATIKKHIVTMKRYVDIQHHKSFMVSANAAIDLILRHENFENRSLKTRPELLSLLFQLLPAHYRDNCQIVTLNSVYRVSAFGKLLKESLPAGRFREQRSSLLKILKKIWFGDEANQMGSFSTSTKEFESHIVRLVESTPTLPATSLLDCKIFLPLEYHSALDSLVHKITDVQKASMGLHRMKESENRGLSQEKPSGQHSVEEHGASGVSSNRKSAAKSTISLEAAHGDRIDDEKKRAISKSREMLHLAKRPKTTCSISSSKDLGENAYQRAIYQSESKMFTGKSNATGVHQIKSNAPKNLSCPLCEKKTEKVCVTLVSSQVRCIEIF